MSERRACELVGLSRTGLRYGDGKERQDEELGERIKSWATQHPRSGYRRAYVLLRREMRINKKRVYRLWKKLGLTVRVRKKRKRLKAMRSVGVRAERVNQIWAYDFMEDACTDGRKLRLLTLIDEYTREALAIEVDRRLPARRVIEVLKRVKKSRGVPECIRSDNGPEFIARKLKRWLAEHQTQTLYIAPGSPWQNGHVESFNGRLRDECLNVEAFVDAQDARRITGRWLQHYNSERPHSSLGNLTPEEFRRKSTQSTTKIEVREGLSLTHVGQT